MNFADSELLFDEQRIRNVLLAYFAALDRRRADLFETVFTEEAVMTAMGGERRMQGRSEIVPWLMTIGRHDHSTHYPASQLIDITGNEARADTFAIAIIASLKDQRTVMVRGIQYLDTLIRTSDGWRIAERQHIPIWQYQIDGSPPALPA